MCHEALSNFIVRRLKDHHSNRNAHCWMQGIVQINVICGKLSKVSIALLNYSCSESMSCLVLSKNPWSACGLVSNIQVQNYVLRFYVMSQNCLQVSGILEFSSFLLWLIDNLIFWLCHSWLLFPSCIMKNNDSFQLPTSIIFNPNGSMGYLSKFKPQVCSDWLKIILRKSSYLKLSLHSTFPLFFLNAESDIVSP